MFRSLATISLLVNALSKIAVIFVYLRLFTPHSLSFNEKWRFIILCKLTFYCSAQIVFYDKQHELKIMRLKSFFILYYYKISSSSLSRRIDSPNSLDSYDLLSILKHPRDGAKCPHKDDECKFLLVGRHWCVYE